MNSLQHTLLSVSIRVTESCWCHLLQMLRGFNYGHLMITITQGQLCNCSQHMRPEPRAPAVSLALFTCASRGWEGKGCSPDILLTCLKPNNSRHFTKDAFKCLFAYKMNAKSSRTRVYKLKPSINFFRVRLLHTYAFSPLCFCFSICFKPK